MPKVSIIIPCFNHGLYIDEALESIKTINDEELYEIIIIDDGSTDELTIVKLKELTDSGYKVIYQHNQGPAASRNNGITIASGEYILPLDSDNKLLPQYLYKAIAILDADEDIAVVYGNARLFGDEKGDFIAGQFNLQRLMLDNFIDVCTVFRRSVWEKTGGFDAAMPYYGAEDWEFWLHAAFLGYKFHYIDEILYEYRVLAGSTVRKLNSSKLRNDAIIEYIEKKYPFHYGPQFVDNYLSYKYKKSPLGFIGKMILKIYFPKKFAKMASKGKLRKYI